MKQISLQGTWSRAGFSLLTSAVLVTAGIGCVGEPLDDENEQFASVDVPLTAPLIEHGALHVSGTHLQDEHGANVQLKGMSLFWSQWSSQFYNSGAIGTIADDWHGSVIRAAMGVEEGGYLANPAAEKAHVVSAVNAAVAKGIYVIIDWHDHNATQHTAQSKQFFTEMAQTYKNTPNVIFEIYNEPVNVSWGQVKSYAQEVIGAIRGAGANNVVIVGTPTWSQDVDAAANDPITAYTNVAYTLHFYAGTHKQAIRDKASYAISKGLALFVTEWGTCDASGNGGLDLNESQTWINFLNQNGLSWANWSLFDKQETASALNPGASTTGGWPDSALTASGAFVKAKMLEGTSNPNPPSTTTGGGTPPGGPGDVTGRVTIRALADNKLVCADNYGASQLIANRDLASTWEEFDVFANSDGSVSLRALANGRFVTAENGGQSPLIANRTSIGDWESFYPSKNSDGSVSFKAKANGLYVCADNGGQSPLIANRDSVSTWEKFWVNPAP
ncbi:Endo-1,4-beta-xylanase A precursor [Minicystis rosea]|nr:Endo-1,4-beta-xylanase A precursor [Minicystis rosea]